MVRAYWLVAVMALALSGCAAKAQVLVEPDVPALDPPSPPPRVVAVSPESPELPPAVSLPEKPTVPPRPPARPARPEPQPEPVRIDPAPPTAPPPLTLKASPGAEAQTETAIRNLLTKVARDLARVNVASLDGDGRAQHDTALRFLRQADDALKVRNVVLAGKLADKAATLASVFVR